MRSAEVVAFIRAREAARLGHGYDPIIAEYRFCNMHREDDRVTKWVAQNWRDPFVDEPDMWFAMAVARMAINSIDTMSDLGFPVPWDRERFLDVLKGRASRGMKVYNPAYMIATPNWTGNKADFLDQRLLTPLWEKRAAIRPFAGDRLGAFHARLFAEYGVGSFTAGQVVADMKYAPPLDKASDWWEWAASGPGSRRGLNRVYGRPLNQPWNETTWLVSLTNLLLDVNEALPDNQFHAQDLQNVMCEFDKYERARLGEGKPKQRYVPHQQPSIATKLDRLLQAFG